MCQITISDWKNCLFNFSKWTLDTLTSKFKLYYWISKYLQSSQPSHVDSVIIDVFTMYIYDGTIWTTAHRRTFNVALATELLLFSFQMTIMSLICVDL